MPKMPRGFIALGVKGNWLNTDQIRCVTRDEKGYHITCVGGEQHNVPKSTKHLIVKEED